MISLQGKRVLLTGALGTLGQAQMEQLTKLGAHVLALDLPNLVDVHSNTNPNVTLVPCDLSQMKESQQIVSDCLAKQGGVNILINNAALIINRPFEEFSLEEYEIQIRVNSSAAFALLSSVIPHMKAKRWGRIINFTSITLNGQVEGYVPYVASKGALLGLTKSLARELGEFGITVNAVAPGAIVSDAEKRVFGHKAQEYSDWVLDRQCLKVRIQPESVAHLVAFLCSDCASMITGQNIGIDGGWS
ncbi:3-ketoacyl-ACP reductase [Vibrio nigripulchritudo]|uniref:SDR family oxidoreductase n=1 Tax=Vibrio nigripulchritudo TaxID=28173 RepID=UPI00190A0689|nr:SDR family oxidoreductase [Vibrio nigripulchritudo]BCL72278.1 3-ketoacyl-ACP reductase [Vibrio nigripulchritudo]BDU33637.1 3-ketoacyl-ACP reductase [Vibrio nigripulchritudo]